MPDAKLEGHGVNTTGCTLSIGIVWWERLGVRRGKEEHVSLIWEEMRLGKRRGCKITCVVCDLPAEGTSDSYHP
ncbi:hypothetical protein CK203_004141 [Vitis vinifera]|uniref:Uncharacterized protein n=1 Tax=Vitis vinifera TaxID=29760 RepID=A0A438KA13_VITVI|nr:hypothetical protein CK203_004141 [Vitis vinifera]